MASLFISYSRRDVDSARRLTDSLKAQELECWVDWEGIEPTLDWWREIEKGIEEADNFLFLLSPDSARSEVCRRELAHAVRNGKRLIPVVVREVRVEDVPSELGHLNWIFSRESDDFSGAFAKLVTAIHTDYAWAQSHRQLQVKALEWERNHRERSFLLRGKELEEAERQLAANTSKEPHPTDLQREYVFRSRRAIDRERRILTGISAGGAIVLAALTLLSVIQADRARSAQATAQANESLALTAQARAEERERLARAGELAAVAVSLLDADPELALHLAVQSVGLARTSQGEESLRRAVVPPTVELTLYGHSGAVYSVAYDAEGKRLVTASGDGTARIWDARTGRPLIVLQGGPEMRRAVFSPDGELVATADADGAVTIWEAGSGEALRELDGGATAVHALAFHPDGSRLLAASDDGTARVWRIPGGQELFVLEGHTAAVRAAEFSPDGALIATGGYDGIMNVWDAASGELLSSISNDGEAVNTLTFSPDSQSILADAVYSAHLWDIASGTRSSGYVGGHTWYLTDVTYSPDGELVVTAGRDHTVGIWDAGFPKPIEVLHGHGGPVYAAAFDPGGGFLATASEDRTVRIWNTGEWRGRTLIGYGGYPFRAAYSPDGRRIGTLDSTGTIRIWDAASGSQLNAWAYPGAYSPNHLHFSPDSRQVIVSGNDGYWGLWEAESGREIYRSSFYWYVVSDARFGSDGRRIIVTDRGGSGFILDAEERVDLVRLEPHAGGMWSGMLSPDGSLAVTAGGDHRAIVWDASDGTQRHALSDHTDLVTSAVFSPDGTRILTASVDGTARVWDVESGSPLLVLDGHTRELTDAAFSPVGPYIATASRDHTVILWNAETGEPVARLFGHGADVFSVEFSPDGRDLLTASFDGTVRISPVQYEDVLALAQSLLSSRQLTCAERVRYLYQVGTCPAAAAAVTPGP